ncbi:MAG: delta-lactam-biosynthetic de-N-acetylase [Clostridiales bacterium]|nr:delta-lactam-biosynthetic de-N-acetylase [Clostridiales bacterium]
MHKHMSITRKKLVSVAAVLALGVLMYLAGAGTAMKVNEMKGATLETSTGENWGLGFGAEGQTPTGTKTAEELKTMDAYYVGDTTEKVLYLTFDAGYENGNTGKILDALKKHHAPATFFVVGNYLETSPDLVQRIVAEGHTVGNHTYHHRDMSAISDKSAFESEMTSVEEKFKEITGQDMIKYYRPPQGKYNENNLKMAKEMGYHTFFWSLAYVDWEENNQPTKEEAFKKLLTRVHPGAIVLLHSTSSTNGEILDELLKKWEEMGYSFKSLSEITG